MSAVLKSKALSIVAALALSVILTPLSRADLIIDDSNGVTASESAQGHDSDTPAERRNTLGYMGLLAGLSTLEVSEDAAGKTLHTGISAGMTVMRFDRKLLSAGAYLMTSESQRVITGERLFEYGVETSLRRFIDGLEGLYTGFRVGAAQRSINVGLDKVTLLEDSDTTWATGLSVGYELPFASHWALNGELGANLVGATRVNAVQMGMSTGAKALVGVRWIF